MSKVRTQVMASVAVIYAVRQLISPIALKAYGLAAASLAVASMVSISHVVNNFFGVGLSGALHFMVVALTHTAGVVQALTFVVFVFALLLIRDIFRSTSRTLVLA